MELQGSDSLLKELMERLEHPFSDPALIEQALTHKSYANEHHRKQPLHNERLEFLGDAVLDFVISDILMIRYPELDEGDLSKMRAGLVSESALAAIARGLDLGPCLKMGRGEQASGGRKKDSILANALEALLAAVYLDSSSTQGVASVYPLVARLFEPGFETGGVPQKLKDYKTELQEWVQSQYKDTVRYTIITEQGPDHHKEFEAAVSHHSKELGRGRGRSKKHAEQAAAKAALEILNPPPKAAAVKSDGQEGS